MPIPKPAESESKSDFMSRCMSDAGMKKEYPEQEQHAAICMSSWRKKRADNCEITVADGDTDTKTVYNMLYKRTNLATLEVRQDLIRNEKLNGRDYIAAPVIPLVAGVHNGELIEYEEIAMFPESWDGRPLSLDHPTDADGKPVTANSPKVMEESVVGFLFNVVAREDLNGISGELWIDVDKANTVPGGAEVLRKLQAGEGLEVSTGYFTFVNNVPGEWKNNKTGSVEKYSSSQYGVRPDHLALLPYDTGACSWKDGCGSPRVNNDTTLQSEIRGNDMPAEKKELTVNGKQLGKVLKGMLAAHADADGKPTAMMQRLAAACGCDMPKMEALIDGTLDFAPQSWLKIMAVVLDADLWDIFSAASNDNSDARYATEKNIPSTKNDLTIQDTVKSTETETTSEKEPCGSCQKSLKVKVQEAVTGALKALGIEKVEKPMSVQISQEISMDKKAKVEALIASDKTRFEAQREWLMGLSDEQIALLTPVAPAAPVVNTEKQVIEEKKEVAAVPVLTKAQILETLGVSEEALTATQSVVEERKAARANKIAEILAADGNSYTEAELKNFNDGLLDKTILMLQPAAIRVAAAVRQQADARTIPPTPSIMLAGPDKGRAN